MPTNTAAYLIAPKVRPLEVKSAPYTSAHGGEIVIKNGAVAINPIDWLLQDQGNFMFTWIKYPFVIGCDVAGEVVEVGPSVTRFKLGDRVVGHALSTDKARCKSAEGAFQTYTVLLASMASPVPRSMSYEQACVMPLGLSTAACGLFQEDQLHLQLPSDPPQASTGTTVLIWGGSSSVGGNAIQLAVAAGYEVITTCSPRNYDYVRKLGASQVFDYSSATVIPDIINAFKGKKCAGAYSIGIGSAEACLDIIDKVHGDKVIAMATYPGPPSPPKRLVALQNIYYFLGGQISIWITAKMRGIRTNFIFGSSLAFNGIGKAIYEDFLPKALANGRFIASPEPLVVGKGLESIQAAFDLQKKGVSAKKVVVSL
ncbi:hypothetical protein MMC19_002568 [Ptychographa xylographoides]|nr:hypothetical protein [Ptychographa xylographoides]